jgi:transposase-like protein
MVDIKKPPFVRRKRPRKDIARGEPAVVVPEIMEDGEEDEKDGRGRPSVYPEDAPQMVYRLALLGLNNDELAVAFGVSRRTIYLWFEQYPEFKQAAEEGRLYADANVARALYKRAVGFDVEETFVTVRKGPDGELKTIEAPIKKHFPPETTACIYWLNNRTRKTGRWTQSQKMEITGPGGGPILLAPADAAQLGGLSNAELEMAASIGMKLIEKENAPSDEYMKEAMAGEEEVQKK